MMFRQIDTCTIPCIKLSSKQNNALSKVMAHGNSILLGHARRLSGEQTGSRVLRDTLYKIKNTNQELAHLLGDNIEEISGHEIGARLGISKEDLDAIFAVRDVEYRIICGYMKLVRKIAYKMSKSGAFKLMDMDDLIMEGIIGLRSAIYSYRDTSVLFLTFGYLCVHRSIIHAMSSDSSFGGISDRTITLLHRFKKAKNAAGFHSTDDDIMEAGGFSPNEIKDLRTLTACMVRESEFCVNGTYADSWLNQVAVKDNSCENFCTSDLSDAIERANLSEMQKELLVASLEDNSGFRSKIAQKYSNPRTGKPFTRMHASNALKKAQKMVFDQLNDKFQKEFLPVSQMSYVA